jgi:hypothetical protein
MTKDFLTSTPIFKNKIPKGRDLTKFEKFKPNKSSQQEDSDSGGWSTDSSGKYIEKKVKKQIQDPFGNDIEIDENLPTIKNCLVRDLETDEFETIEEYERKIIETHIGYKIPVPNINTKNYTNYIIVRDFIINKNSWTKQSDIRKYSGIEDTRYMNHLRKIDPEMSNKGLLWRKSGKEYEYIYI